MPDQAGLSDAGRGIGGVDYIARAGLDLGAQVRAVDDIGHDAPAIRDDHVPGLDLLGLAAHQGIHLIAPGHIQPNGQLEDIQVMPGG